MSVKGVVVTVLLFGSFGTMNAADAQVKMTRSQTDPADKLFRLVAPDGTMVAADGETNRFFIETPGGESFEITFDQALAAAEPDPSKRDRLESDFEAALADAELANYSYVHELELSPPVPCQPPPGKIFCEIQPYSVPGVNQLASGAFSEEEDDEDVTDLDRVTVTARRPQIMTIGGAGGAGFWSGGIIYGNPYKGGSNKARDYQQCWAEDYDDFKRSQGEACFNANAAAATGVGALLTAGELCLATAVTAGGGGVGAVGCAGAAIVYVVSLVTTFHYERQCLAEYTEPEHC